MSILIKGMEMPKDCLSCRWHHRTGVCTLTGVVTNTGKDCPLVPVPTPHGRLIDASDLSFSMTDSIDQGIAEEVVADAPTIIEAEEGETHD